jgi:hypothetical protein
MNYIIMSLLALLLLVPITATYASTGMSNCTEEPENDDCNPQPDRVGNDHDEDDEVTRDGPDDKGEENCWGKVTSSLTQNDDDQPGIGEHSSDPRPGDDDNETPREGVGNQDEDHPSDHADTVGGLADDQPDCVD